jgi:hypothetical protein
VVGVDLREVYPVAQVVQDDQPALEKVPAGHLSGSLQPVVHL